MYLLFSIFLGLEVILDVPFDPVWTLSTKSTSSSAFMSPRPLGSGMPRAITTGKWVKQAKYKTWVNQAAKMKNFLSQACAIFYAFFFLTMGRAVVELQSCVMQCFSN